MEPESIQKEGEVKGGLRVSAVISFAIQNSESTERERERI